MAKEARVPDIGNYRDVPVIELLVAVGDTVAADQGLVTLESDKATMEVPAPFAGVVRELKVKVGDTVSEGDVVALIEEAPPASVAVPAASPPASVPSAPAAAPPAAAPPATTSAAPQPAAPQPAPPAEAATPPATAASAPPVAAHAPADPTPLIPGHAPYASPAVRAFARELGVDLAKVSGSGRNGRILEDDVKAYVKRTLAAPPTAASSGSGAALGLLPWPEVDFAKFGPVERQPLSKIKRLSGANLARNWVMIPHVTQFERADITEMEAFRKAEAQRYPEVRLTPLVFLIKAVVAALKRFPQFNASLAPGGEELVLKRYFHIGIAVDTPDGLVVPVIRDCDRKGLLELARELGEVSQKARAKKLTPADMSGGCFSISSLGGIGGTAFTPIVNAPEVAILGVSKASTEPVWDGTAFRPRLMLPLSLSYDHRVIDGADAARFAAYLAEVLGDVRRLLL
jgi:pyruvate dehydrogenase E2 component (dihydrolipoamide acetyltransferase)